MRNPTQGNPVFITGMGLQCMDMSHIQEAVKIGSIYKAISYVIEDAFPKS